MIGGGRCYAGHYTNTHHWTLDTTVTIIRQGAAAVVIYGVLSL